VSGKTNLCQLIRGTQGKGLMPDGSSRFSLDGKQILHCMGTSTFANHIVVPEIELAKIRSDAPFDTVCYIGCGVTTGVGAVLFTAEVEAGANVVVGCPSTTCICDSKIVIGSSRALPERARYGSSVR
jgi:S-(hydroxymethyl)glutathione dehydrogenase/alcohol dehydrogenase